MLNVANMTTNGGDVLTKTNLLLKKIEESGLKINHLANLLDITSASLRNKINNRTAFKVSEMERLSQALDLSDEEMKIIFFTIK